LASNLLLPNAALATLKRADIRKAVGALCFFAACLP
jgi:hypothetical protein